MFHVSERCSEIDERNFVLYNADSVVKCFVVLLMLKVLKVLKLHKIIPSCKKLFLFHTND